MSIARNFAKVVVNSSGVINRNNLDVETVAKTGSYTDLINKPTLGTAAATASTDYATAAQGTKADSALQPSTIGSTVQGYDADLQAIGAISGTSGILQKTAANTWSLDTNTYATTTQLTTQAATTEGNALAFAIALG